MDTMPSLKRPRPAGGGGGGGGGGEPGEEKEKKQSRTSLKTTPAKMGINLPSVTENAVSSAPGAATGGALSMNASGAEMPRGGDDDAEDAKIGDDKIVEMEANAQDDDTWMQQDPITERENRRMEAMLRTEFSAEQSERYEKFRRSGGPKFRNIVKKIASSACGYDIGSSHTDKETAIAIAGVTKLLVGQLVEAALGIMQRRGAEHDGIKPDVLREAYAELVERGKMKTRARSKIRFSLRS